jgi:hypothetical protein
LFVTLGVATSVYLVFGFFGAARFGRATEGDLLRNAWLPPAQQGYLDAAVALYLCLSMAPMVVALRVVLSNAAPPAAAGGTGAGGAARATVALSGAAAVAWCFPSAAERLFAVTGATAVCAVAYVLPVLVHASLYFRADAGGGAGAGGDAALETWLLEDAALLTADAAADDAARRGSSVLPPGAPPPNALGEGRRARRYRSWREDLTAPPLRRAALLFSNVVVPTAVLAAGCASCTSALVLALQRW